MKTILLTLSCLRNLLWRKNLPSFGRVRISFITLRNAIAHLLHISAHRFLWFVMHFVKLLTLFIFINCVLSYRRKISSKGKHDKRWKLCTSDIPCKNHADCYKTREPIVMFPKQRSGVIKYGMHAKCWVPGGG